MRHERAIQAVSPRTGSRCDASEDVYQLFHSVGWLGPDLVAGLGGGGAQATTTTVPLLRLLASDAASSLKTNARLGGGSSDLAAECMTSGPVLICWGVCWDALLIPVLPLLDGNRGGPRQARQVAEEAAKAAAPALICLLLPRLAALAPTDMGAVVGINTLAKMLTGLQWGPDRSLRVLTSSHAMQLLRGSLLAFMDGCVAEGSSGVVEGGCVTEGSSGGGGSSVAGGEVSDGEGNSRRSNMHQAIGSLGGFACILASLVRLLVTRGCDGAPVGSPQLRDMLARPVFQLLSSPLLDLLARMQHVPVDTAWATVTHSAPSPSPPGERAPVRQMPMLPTVHPHSPPAGPTPLPTALMPMQPDADDAKFVMQVRWAHGLGRGLGLLDSQTL